MASYESDHNISRSAASSRAAEGQPVSSSQNANSQHSTTTLTEAINQFFDASGLATTRNSSDLVSRVIAGLRSINTEATPDMLQQLESLQSSLLNGEDLSAVQKVPDEYFDNLDRIDKKKLGPDDACPICTSNFLEDEYPLVVKLAPCGHKYDLDCIRPWLMVKKSCPLCRADVFQKRKIEVPEDSEEEDYDDMYGMNAASSNNSLKKLLVQLVNKLEKLPAEKLNPSILFKESQYERFRPYIDAPKKYEIQDRKPSVKEIIFRKPKKQVLNKGEDFTEENIQKYIGSLDNLSTNKIKNYYNVGDKLYKPAGYPNYYDRLLGEINGTNKETWFSAFRTVVFGK